MKSPHCGSHECSHGSDPLEPGDVGVGVLPLSSLDCRSFPVDSECEDRGPGLLRTLTPVLSHSTCLAGSLLAASRNAPRVLSPQHAAVVLFFWTLIGP